MLSPVAHAERKKNLGKKSLKPAFLSCSACFAGGIVHTYVSCVLTPCVYLILSVSITLTLPYPYNYNAVVGSGASGGRRALLTVAYSGHFMPAYHSHIFPLPRIWPGILPAGLCMLPPFCPVFLPDGVCLHTDIHTYRQRPSAVDAVSIARDRNTTTKWSNL